MHASKIVEVIAKILEEMNNNYSLEEVNKLIVRSNLFDENTLGIAYSLIHDKVLAKKSYKNKTKSTGNASFRIFAQDEISLLGIENCNYLLKLQNLGLLSPNDLEELVEQLLEMPEEEIHKEEINLFVLLSLIELQFEVLPGSRFLLYSSDTIN